MNNYSRNDLKVIENHVYDFDKIRLLKKVRIQELLEQGDIFYHNDSYYKKLDLFERSVNESYESMNEEEKSVLRLRYFEPELGLDTWNELAEEFGYSKTSILRIRNRFLTNIAMKMNYVSVDVDMKEKPKVKTKRDVSPRLRFKVLKRDDFKCKYCGANPDEDEVKLHVDHVVPLSKGGTNKINNLVTSCVDCNIGKSDTLI